MIQPKRNDLEDRLKKDDDVMQSLLKEKHWFKQYVKLIKEDNLKAS